jgi:flavorubredoxin
MPTQVLFENEIHKNVLLEDFTSGEMVQANQHVIVHAGKAILMDPGGHKVYAQVLAELSTVVGLSALDSLFFSHQDPDIVASANGWLMVTDAHAYLPKPWIRFVMHFGVDDMVLDRIIPIPDTGLSIDLNGCTLLVIPAHFMHSVANFQVYDPVAKILYSGDLGASLGQSYTVVEDFDEHIQYMSWFHQRYIVSSKVLTWWLNMINDLDIEIIAPQHGAMMIGKEMVNQFKAWLSNLACGLDVMEGIYKLPKS